MQISFMSFFSSTSPFCSFHSFASNWLRNALNCLLRLNECFNFSFLCINCNLWTKFNLLFHFSFGFWPRNATNEKTHHVKKYTHSGYTPILYLLYFLLIINPLWLLSCIYDSCCCSTDRERKNIFTFSDFSIN